MRVFLPLMNLLSLIQHQKLLMEKTLDSTNAGANDALVSINKTHVID